MLVVLLVVGPTSLPHTTAPVVTEKATESFPLPTIVSAIILRVSILSNLKVFGLFLSVLTRDSAGGGRLSHGHDPLCQSLLSFKISAIQLSPLLKPFGNFLENLGCMNSFNS